MKPYWTDGERTIYCGDCRLILPELSGISGVATDPPYELGFMGKDWDKQGISFQSETWRIIKDSCKPGAMMLCFGGTRTWHRIAVAIEDGGWDIRDTCMWLYSQGFPKSLNIGLDIDRQACREQMEKRLGRKPTKEEFKAVWKEFREKVISKWAEHYPNGPRGSSCQFSQKGIESNRVGTPMDSLPSTPEAQLWDGYGTALKPAFEPIILAMKPLDGTFAENALRHGVAGLNIDGSRIPVNPEVDDPRLGGKGDWSSDKMAKNVYEGGYAGERVGSSPLGRFPANLILDEEAAQMLDEQTGELKSGDNCKRTKVGNFLEHGGLGKAGDIQTTYGDSGGASRFFYCAKASKSERNRGCEDIETEVGHNRFDQCAKCGGYILQNQDRPSACHCESPERVHNKVKGNPHPTVKPISLMRYLCNLLKPPTGGVLLDPFMGSGSTLLACQDLGIRAIGVDTSEHNCEIAVKRLAANRKQQAEMPL